MSNNYSVTPPSKSFKFGENPKKPKTGFIRFILIVLLTIVCYIPAEIWYAIYKFSSPEGFWQKFAVMGGGLVVFGSIQLVAFFCWIVGVIMLIIAD